jgi:hypothetical protein
VWILNGTSVVRRADLNWQCGAASGCSSEWKLVGTGDFNNDGQTDVLWYAPSSGIVSAWILNGTSVVRRADLSWQCSTASGCASDWKFAGTGDFNNDGQTDVLWYAPSSGIVSAWILNGTSVVRRADLNWQCSAASGCASEWKLVGTGDFNQDARTDVLWYAASSGIVSAWILNGTSVVRRADVNWTCSAASGCASQWKLVGTGKFH